MDSFHAVLSIDDAITARTRGNEGTDTGSVVVIAGQVWKSSPTREKVAFSCYRSSAHQLTMEAALLPFLVYAWTRRIAALDGGKYHRERA